MNAAKKSILAELFALMNSAALIYMLNCGLEPRKYTILKYFQWREKKD